MKFAEDSIKRPDLSRNEALAGKTVYAIRWNIHYDHLGYAVKDWDPDQPLYAGTTKSYHAQPIEDALAGKPFTEDWTGLIPWNNGAPTGEKLTVETEAAYREKYYAELREEDEARRKRDDELNRTRGE